MKKTTKKTTVKATKKSKSWVALLVAFCIGAVFGAVVYANHEIFDFSAKPNCPSGDAPDKNGCCDGELYIDMGDLGYNCCPESGGDCFPPIK